jgi:purine-binding chemotaxis protein CheW
MNPVTLEAERPTAKQSVAFDESERAPIAPTQIISFAIGDDQYGVDIMSVREIKGWSDITHLPRQPEYMRGVLNLRGAIVPIIVQIGSRLVGLLADRVLDIVTFEANQVQPVPRVSQGARLNFLSGLVTIDTTMIALIDLPNLVDGAALGETRATTI